MGATWHLIAEASSDERLSSREGKSGNQTGYELRSRIWYLHSSGSWTCVFRPNDPIEAELISRFMERAVTNGCIGYDQSERSTLYRLLEGVEWNPSMITENCETDCSALTYCAVYSVTGIRWRDDFTQPTTSNIESYFMNMCQGHFTKLTDPIYLESDDYLQRGDIILKEGRHVGVYV